MSLDTTPAAGTRVVLVGVQLPDVSSDELDTSLDELRRLAKTLGLVPIARVTQHRSGTGGATVLGSGKLRELARWTGGRGFVPSPASNRTSGSRPADDEPDHWEELREPLDPIPDDERAQVVVFDQDLTPRQLRNLESATGAEVLDRSSVILSIFQRHARTREARIQVEIARLTYMAPRLRVSSRGHERQQGGIGGRGAGESSLELDRRRVRDRIAELRHELVTVQREAQTRRARRVRSDTVALVGYTNAGKSSLMRALTGSDVLVANQLFATLDTTVRALHPETRPRLLVSDTVGFIKKLPHDLVASFRSTLEEAGEATLLLHIVDAADPAWRSQVDVTHEVLGEVGAADRPTVLVFNKIDKLDAETIAELEQQFPKAMHLSAFRPDDVQALHARIVAFFERQMAEFEFVVPYDEQRHVHLIHESCRVVSESFEEDGTRLRVLAPPDVLDQIKARLECENASRS